MKHLKILNKREVRRILEMLIEQWGAVPELDYVFMQNTKDKIYIVKRNVFDLDQSKLRIDTLGMYFGKIEKGWFRLSIEGSQLVGPTAKKNVLDIKNSKEWMAGEDMKTDFEDGIYLIKKHDFLGCGKVKEGLIMNYIPKPRRI